MRAVGEHLEILRVALRRCVGIRLVERVGHAHAFDRLLLDAIDRLRRLDARGFEDRRHDVDHVMELGADTAGVLDMAGPRNGHALPGPAEVRRHLLGPLERRIKCPRPRHRHMRVGLVGSPVLVMQHQLGSPGGSECRCRRSSGWSALQGAFGAGAVVAADVDDQRVVEFAHAPRPLE